MSELRDECYKCLNNQKCLGGAEYGSLYCMMNRRLKMQNEDDGVYAHKFATMQKQIDDKDKKIKELEEENNNLKRYSKEIIKEKQELTTDLLDSIPVARIKNKIEELKKQKEELKYTTKLGLIQRINAEIRLLEELLEKNNK